MRIRSLAPIDRLRSAAVRNRGAIAAPAAIVADVFRKSRRGRAAVEGAGLFIMNLEVTGTKMGRVTQMNRDVSKKRRLQSTAEGSKEKGEEPDFRALKFDVRRFERMP